MGPHSLHSLCSFHSFHSLHSPHSLILHSPCFLLSSCSVFPPVLCILPVLSILVVCVSSFFKLSVHTLPVVPAVLPVLCFQNYVSSSHSLPLLFYLSTRLWRAEACEVCQSCSHMASDSTLLETSYKPKILASLTSKIVGQVGSSSLERIYSPNHVVGLLLYFYEQPLSFVRLLLFSQEKRCCDSTPTIFGQHGCTKYLNPVHFCLPSTGNSVYMPLDSTSIVLPNLLEWHLF